MKLVLFGMYTTSLNDNDMEHLPLDGWNVMELKMRFLPMSLPNTSRKASSVPDGRVMISSTAITIAFAVVVGAKEDVGLELGWKSSVGGDDIVELSVGKGVMSGGYAGVDVIGSLVMIVDIAVPGTNGTENNVISPCPKLPPCTTKPPFDVTL